MRMCVGSGGVERGLGCERESSVVDVGMWRLASGNLHSETEWKNF